MPLTALKGPYIPRADGALREWLDNFVAVVAREPWAVMLTPAKAAAIVELAERYARAYVRAKSPGTRSRVAVKAKNTVRREVWKTLRPIAMLIKHNAGVSDQQKMALGIYPPLGGQSPIPAPRSRPGLDVVELGRGFHRLRFRDPSSPRRFAKPYGAVAMQLLIVVRKRAATSHEKAHRLHVATKHVFDVKFKPEESGKTATYFARWVTRRGGTGPWSKPLALTIV